MTKKQHQILEAALHLFSKEGYHATSTSKIAKRAQVSEGLIFRHFTNKVGLLDVIIKEGEKRIQTLLLPIINEEDPKQIIKNTLEMPFYIEGTALEFWELQYKLKWTLGDKKIQTLEPLKGQLVRAFEKLRYRHPELETEFLTQHLMGVMTSLILGGIPNTEKAKQFLLRKYHLQ